MCCSIVSALPRVGSFSFTGSRNVSCLERLPLPPPPKAASVQPPSCGLRSQYCICLLQSTYRMSCLIVSSASPEMGNARGHGPSLLCSLLPSSRDRAPHLVHLCGRADCTKHAQYARQSAGEASVQLMRPPRQFRRQCMPTVHTKIPRGEINSPCAIKSVNGQGGTCAQLHLTFHSPGLLSKPCRSPGCWQGFQQTRGSLPV